MSKVVLPSNTNCWLWSGAHTGKDRISWFSIGGTNIKASWASYLIHYGPIPNGMEVCHKCDIPECVNPGHLFLGTHIENMADMARKGRNPGNGGMVGERHGSAKLSNAQVAAIREALQQGVRDADLARQYGVTPALINNIKHNRARRHG